MTKFLEKYKGLILLIIVFGIMLNMYKDRIAEIREQETIQVNIVEKR